MAMPSFSNPSMGILRGAKVVGGDEHRYGRGCPPAGDGRCFRSPLSRRLHLLTPPITFISPEHHAQSERHVSQGWPDISLWSGEGYASRCFGWAWFQETSTQPQKGKKHRCLSSNTSIQCIESVLPYGLRMRSHDTGRDVGWQHEAGISVTTLATDRSCTIWSATQELLLNTPDTQMASANDLLCQCWSMFTEPSLPVAASQMGNIRTAPRGAAPGKPLQRPAPIRHYVCCLSQTVKSHCKDHHDTQHTCRSSTHRELEAAIKQRTRSHMPTHTLTTLQPPTWPPLTIPASRRKHNRRYQYCASREQRMMSDDEDKHHLSLSPRTLFLISWPFLSSTSFLQKSLILLVSNLCLTPLFLLQRLVRLAGV